MGVDPLAAFEFLLLLVTAVNYGLAPVSECHVCAHCTHERIARIHDAYHNWGAKCPDQSCPRNKS